MTRYAAGALLALLLTAPAAGQGPVAPPGAPGPAPAMVPMSGAQFRQAAMASDAFEVQSSMLALERSRNPAVRRFAQVMLRDHRDTTKALGGAAAVAGPLPGGLVGPLVAAPIQAAGAAAAPAAPVAGAPRPGAAPAMPLDPRHAAMLSQLAALGGRGFDRLYARMQVAGHQEAVAMFAAYAQTGDDPGLRALAAKILPTLQHHLAMAHRLAGRRD